MICIICSERLKSEIEIVSVLCGHVFHSDCLSKWLESSETCPECRKPVSSKDITKLHLNIDDNDGCESTADLQTRVDDLKAELEEKNKELESAEKTLKVLQLLNAALEKGHVD
ncbi:hypothetical protein TNIN_307601 [Trichonephila inaurata madagascariensis]|uniref:RING-type domain-containing protein n=1 Tax=Trichonephila inaurata madagascariensis TaxID=2747483 RepID=A0A8X6IQ87_9ARAC|nr:hypothetical protein TNIN_307601 [Trichonephila inaurata madagascariensis]